MLHEPLLLAATGFLVANLIHGADHLRQGITGLPMGVLAVGPVVTLSAIAVFWLAWRRHPRAALFAAVIGTWDGILIAQAHMAPRWGTFSDPYPAIHADLLSWVVMVAEAGSAFALGAVGLVYLRRQSRTRRALT